MATLAARGRELTDSETSVRVRARRAAAGRCRTCPSADAPPVDTVLREVGESGRDRPRPPGARRRDDRHGARRGAVRARGSPTCAATSCCSSSRWCSTRWRSCRRGLRAGDPAGARARAGAVRHRMLPDTEQQIYHLPEDDLYLVGTSEVALASLHRDEILDAEELPLRYAGFSPCFRREAGAAGKDTRGIFRVHQFDKVEMFAFVEPGHVGRGARADPRDRGVDPDRARDPLPRRRDRRRRPRRLGRQASTTARRGCPARASSASSPRARTRPTTRRGGSTSATAATTASPPTCTRSTAPPSPWPDA